MASAELVAGECREQDVAGITARLCRLQESGKDLVQTGQR